MAVQRRRLHVCNVGVSHEPFSNGLLFHELVHVGRKSGHKISMPVRFVLEAGKVHLLPVLALKWRTLGASDSAHRCCRTGAYEYFGWRQGLRFPFTLMTGPLV